MRIHGFSLIYQNMNEQKITFIHKNNSVWQREENRMVKKERFKMNGLTILGITLALIGVGTIIYGGTLFPVNILDNNFMSFLVGGIVFISIGICMISGLLATIKIAFIWISAIALILYINNFEMAFVLRLLNFIPIIGLGIWLTTKWLK